MPARPLGAATVAGERVPPIRSGNRAALSGPAGLGQMHVSIMPTLPPSDALQACDVPRVRDSPRDGGQAAPERRSAAGSSPDRVTVLRRGTFIDLR